MFNGMQVITITQYTPADTVAPHYLNDGMYPALVAPGAQAGRNSGLVPVVALNCSAVPRCHLDGVTITASSQYSGFSAKPAPAIRVYSGDVSSVTILSSQTTGSLDVLDANNVPVGSWVSRSAGGFTLVGRGAAAGGTATRTGEARLSAGGMGSAALTGAHAALVGASGERGARFAIDHDGSLHWGDGESDTFQTTIQTVESASSLLPSMALEPHGSRTSRIVLPSSNESSSGRLSDGSGTMSTCDASHEALTEENPELEISCRVAKNDVIAVLRNHGSKPATLEAGRALVVVRWHLL